MELKEPRVFGTSKERNRVYVQITHCIELCDSDEALNELESEYQEELVKFKEVVDREDNNHGFDYYKELKDLIAERRLTLKGHYYEARRKEV